MAETGYFYSGNNRLSYVCTITDGHVPDVGVIFVHAGGGNRLGPHRMFVEFTSRLEEKGIVSIRFDMQGCGDSEGETTNKDITCDMKDLLSAIEFFLAEKNLKKIFLFGISRGSKVILSVLTEKQVPVAGAILLSIPLSSPRAVVQSVSSQLKGYMYKFQNPKNLKKLLAGRANIKQVIKTLIFAFSSFERYRRSNDGFATRCPLLFIYGQKDPVATDSQRYYSKMCEKHKVPFMIENIGDANHSFFHYEWKEEIFNTAEQWLQEIIENKRKDESFST